ncbi:hypothetical protein BHM03_00041438 [Ensete ventricosum]|nr:hypothetical protein BHM03_00041438 [Ensete ventricosum]
MRSNRHQFLLLLEVSVTEINGVCVPCFRITFSLNLYNVGVKYTSASLASATTNSVPVFTFFFAVLFRMESIKMKGFSGVGKALGVGLCMAGVVMTALYRGPRIHPLNLHLPSGHHRMSHLDEEPAVSKSTWIKGTLFVITATMTWSLWLVLQVISTPPSSTPPQPSISISISMVLLNHPSTLRRRS